MHTAYHARLSTSQLLIAYRANINAIDSKGYCALHHAAQQGKL